MKNQLDTVCDVSRRLAKLGVPYMLTGSVAMNHYAEPRMTRDIDLVVHLRPEDVQPLVDEFGSDYYVDGEVVREAVRHSSIFNMIRLEGVVKVDCVIRKSSEYRELEFQRRKDVEVGGCSTCVVSREDLILSKLVWAKDSHSEMQLRDVANLMRGGYDREYVGKWSVTLGVGDLLGDIQKELGHE